MFHILHIDTSATSGLVAVSCKGKLLSCCTTGDMQNQAATINETIAKTIAEASITLSQLDAIVTCAGPGSYTGVRIALATAKGLCFALDIPLLSDNKLVLLAYQALVTNGQQHSEYVSIIKARDNEYFICMYNNKFEATMQPALLLKPAVETLLQGTNLCICTNTFDSFIDDLAKTQNHTIIIQEINAGIWAEYAGKAYNEGNFVNLFSFTPFYMKDVYIHNKL